MNSFPFAHAGVLAEGPVTEWTGWQDLVVHCLAEFPAKARGVGLLYVTDPLAGDVPAILEFLKERTGVAEWSGAVAPAICAGGIEYFDTPAMAMMAFDLPEDAVTSFSGTQSQSGAGSQNGGAFAIVHANPHAPGVIDAVPEAAQATGAYLVGGLATGDTQNPLISDDETGLAGLLFDPTVPVATGLTQGCSPIGPMHEITAMQDELVAELDGRPAVEILQEDVGELLARDLRRVAGYVHAAIPVSGSDQADYTVRNLMGMDVSQGLIAVAEALEVGDRMMFVRRDAASAVEDMQRMLDDLKRRAGDQIRGAVYHSCVARGPHQFGPGSKELTMIGETFADVPVIGFFGNGEISNDRLYTYTGILSLFLDPPENGAE
ncbi:MAG: histidine kinase [Rhodospirillaceae bacterium]|nr:histidine kinase [Rhodospirillaceae bacterium]MBT4773115.1 histidine kinase [Rhodospirillaceae bacterium]MBT5358423.1 histidine kinase [Rhodospirillaceae bacterium]MBT5768461.1 histidine kinase [Rhodospirillaceae bacterium]MBT6308290.1 histidine kinase [Rhodospirillaceae bacterium]